MSSTQHLCGHPQFYLSHLLLPTLSKDHPVLSVLIDLSFAFRRFQITVKPGKGDELLPWITKLKAQVAGEKDTLEYTFARDKPNGDTFVIWERYTSVEAWRK